MEDSELQPFLIFPAELGLHAQLFADSPLRIIDLFLQCFDEDGHQKFGVPRHVLEAMAVRLRRFKDGREPGLDAAFGGRTARQRNRIRREGKDYGVIWDHIGEHERAKATSREAGRIGTPTEEADEATARAHGMSAENVRKINRRGRRRS